jgi:hypothetical protein
MVINLNNCKVLKQMGRWEGNDTRASHIDINVYAIKGTKHSGSTENRYIN